MSSRRTAILALVLALSSCSGKRQSPTEESSAAPKVDLAPRLASVGALADAPEPTPELAPGTALTAANTLVITEAELADVRAGRAKDSPAAPSALAFVAIVRERGQYELPNESKLSRNTLSIWDLDARRWVGSLWVSVALTPKITRSMVYVRNGKEVGPSFLQSETPDQIAARYAKTRRDAFSEALEDRRQVWSEWRLSRPAFDPAREKPYRIPVPADRPTRGAADAKVVVQLFVQQGDIQDALRVARIAQVYGDRVRVVARNRTLDFEADTEPAAQASLEVFAQGGAPAFWRYFDALAEVPRTSAMLRGKLDLTTLVDKATALGGIDAAKLRTAIETHAHAAAIEVDMDALRKAGVGGRTTTWLVNDWLITSGDWAAIEGPIQAALAQ